MRYWAFIDHWGNWHGQRLITPAQYRIVHHALAGTRPEFISLNNYTTRGDQVQFRLVFDLDSPDTDKARHETAEVAITLARLTKTEPAIYFSGNKGYHVETDFQIDGDRAHEIALLVTRLLFSHLTTIDTKIYRQRSMFRLPNSPASKKGYFKVRLDPADLDFPSDYHRELSARRLHAENLVLQTPDFSRLAELALQCTQQLLPRSNIVQNQNAAANDVLPVTPCIERIASKRPAEGQRNLSIFVLARHFKGQGYTEEEALKALQENDNLSDLHREIVTVTKSIYRSSRDVRIGCKGLSNEAALMRDNCDNWCPFSSVPLPTPTRRVSETGMATGTVLQGKTLGPTTMGQQPHVVRPEESTGTHERACQLPRDATH